MPEYTLTTPEFVEAIEAWLWSNRATRPELANVRDVDVLAAHDAEVARKTLEDAADELDSGVDIEEMRNRTSTAPLGWADESIHEAIQASGPITDWLRARAVSISTDKAGEGE